MPKVSFTHPEHLLIQCGAPATRLSGWSWEVGSQSTLPFVYTSPADPWIFNNRGVMVALIIHYTSERVVPGLLGVGLSHVSTPHQRKVKL